MPCLLSQSNNTSLISQPQPSTTTILQPLRLDPRKESRNSAGPSRRLIDDVVLASATALGRDSSRAGDLLEVDRRVVRSTEPVEAPVAAGLEGLREVVAIGPRVDAAVSVAPAVLELWSEV